MKWIVTAPGENRPVDDEELGRYLESVGLTEFFAAASHGMQAGEVRKIWGIFFERVPTQRELH